MIRDRLKDVQIKADISCAEWSKMTDVPEATIRKILSGDTPDPRFDTIVKLVTPLGVSLDDIVGAKKEVEIENNAVMVLKEAYEARIDALRERVEDVKKYAESLHRDKKILGLVALALGLVIVGILIFDIALGSHGWVQY